MSFKIESPSHWPITIPNATSTSDGVMSAADKAKIDGLAESVFIFRPGGVDGDNVYTSWVDLYAATLNVQGSFLIQIDSTIATATVPPGVYDFGGRCTIGPIAPNVGNPPDPNNFENRLNVSNGAVLRDVASLRGPVAVRTFGTTTPNFEFTGTQLLVLSEGAHILNQGTQPVVRVTNPALSFVTFFSFSAGYDSPPNAPFLDLAVGGVQAVILSSNGVNFASTNFATGVAGAFLFFLYDASVVPPTFPGFAGTLAVAPSDQSEGVFYNDTIIFPALGSDNVQGAIDALKAFRTLRESYLAAAANADNTLPLDSVRGGLRLDEPVAPPLAGEPMLHLISNTGFPILQVVTDGYPGLPFSGTGRGGVGFLGHAPSGQYTPSGATGTVTPGVGANVTDDTLFTGTIGTTAYTIGEIVDALKMFGFIKE